ncbi:unnamed protein product [Knipowitschia caucasica]|uniref:Uncharacterized protein n=1 Tax=Knipowitschia caucasica TaxID=637954 RepID=A0AAV2KJM7_KNICA
MSSSGGAQQWVSHPSKLPSVKDSCTKKCCCDQICPVCLKGDTNLTTHRSDYQSWNTNFLRQPYKHPDNFKITQGMNLVDKGHEPMENQSNYKLAYLPHPPQLRSKLDMPRIQASSIQLGQPCHGVVHHQRPWTSDAKLGRNGKDKDTFLSTTHADYIWHPLQRTLPIIQGRQSSAVKSKAPFAGTTTMRDDFKKWDLPRRPSTAQTDKKDWTKGYSQISFSTCANKANHCSKCFNHRDNSVFECGRRRRGTWIRSDAAKEQGQRGCCMLHSKLPQSSSFRNKNL